MKALGIDIGTTTVSAVVMDLSDRAVIESRTVPNGGFIPGQPFEKLQDPDSLVKKARGAVDELLGLHPDVSAIGLTGQMHGIVYLDAEGKAVSPLYNWEDASGDQPLADGTTVVGRLRKRGGVPAAAGFGCITYLYHVQTGRVPAEAVTFCTVMDYLGMALTGRTAPLVHVSNAAGLGLFDAETLSFRADILEQEGGEPAMLPEVTTEVSVLGTYRGIPVTAALGDHQAAFLGSIGFDQNIWSINVGTSSQISVLSDTYFEAEGIDVRPYLNGKYLLTGAALCGGRAYAILETFFRRYARALGAGEEARYDVLSALAAAADPEAGGLQVETTFSGTRTDPLKKGSITGITEANFTPENLARGVLRGIVQELYAFHQLICRGTSIGDSALVTSGNACRKNPILREEFAHIFGAEVRQAVYTEEAASGAAISTLQRTPD